MSDEPRPPVQLGVIAGADRFTHHRDAVVDRRVSEARRVIVVATVTPIALLVGALCFGASAEAVRYLYIATLAAIHGYLAVGTDHWTVALRIDADRGLNIRYDIWRMRRELTQQSLQFRRRAVAAYAAGLTEAGDKITRVVNEVNELLEDIGWTEGPDSDDDDDDDSDDAN